MILQSFCRKYIHKLHFPLSQQKCLFTAHLKKAVKIKQGPPFGRPCLSFTFYFFFVRMARPPVKTIILTASSEKSSATTTSGLESLPRASTFM